MPSGRLTSRKYLEDGLILVSAFAVLLVIINSGFSQTTHGLYSRWFPAMNLVAFVLLAFRMSLSWKARQLQLRWYAGQTFVLTLMLLGLVGEFFFHRILSSIHVTETLTANVFIYHAIFVFLFLEEVSTRLFSLQKSAVNAPFLLLVSFLFFILVGSLLLMLPSATTRPISYVDALFTSTSAVCVTGLVVLDTATDFSLFGKWVILFLIQIGGLGILTFTNLFGIIFSGSTTFQNQMLIQNMLNVQNLADALKALVRIVVITLIIEMIGGLVVFFMVDSRIFSSFGEHAFFSIFHSISAFCNAGFSTLGNDNLYHESVRYAYGLHMVIAVLIIFGGIGFGILLNVLQYFREKILQVYCLFIQHRPYRFKPQIITLNTRIVVVTTLILLVAGMLLFYIFEYHNTLRDHPTIWGKLVESFFGSVTPRTAGFNVVNIAEVTIPTLMIYFLLMWIGGSPGSTAGGIKTSVFAVATLNFINQVLGKERTELGRREIPAYSIQKAFAVISLSLIAVGMCITLIILNDGGKFDLLKIGFEAFSALGTVGLSMGITPYLSDFSKIVLIFTMLIGRVGFLTILIGLIQLFRKEREKQYRYPKEDLFIT